MLRVRHLVALAPLVVFLAAGCGGESRVDVKGVVKYNGKPIPKGEIRFVPVGQGTVSGASITDGNYEVKGANAVLSGKCKVEITASRPLGGKQDPNIPFQQEEQYLPAKYNTKTTLEFDVPSKGPVQKDFDLEQ